MKIECATERRKANTFLSINEASINNLHHINAAIPLNVMIAVAGVSGSGKSSLVIDILYNELMKQLKGINPHIQYTARLSGYESIQDIVAIDATPIGRMKRSNVATYVGIFDNIREIYADTQEAKDKGFTASMFSFNCSPFTISLRVRIPV
jgi:excinuclease ABC subunit A